MDINKILEKEFIIHYYYVTPNKIDPIWNDYLKEHREKDNKPLGKLPIGLFENTSETSWL